MTTLIDKKTGVKPAVHLYDLATLPFLDDLELERSLPIPGIINLGGRTMFDVITHGPHPAETPARRVGPETPGTGPGRMGRFPALNNGRT